MSQGTGAAHAPEIISETSTDEIVADARVDKISPSDHQVLRDNVVRALSKVDKFKAHLDAAIAAVAAAEAELAAADAESEN